MSKKDTSAPAFPTTDRNGVNYGDCGMTMRDYFAAKAMVGICHFWVQARTETDISDPAPAIVASMSYELADAMLAERAK